MKKLSIIITLAFIALISCSDNNSTNPTNDKGEYGLEAKYNYIRSYPNGGGIFIVYISPNEDFSGLVQLSLNCDSKLNAKLVNTTLGTNKQLAEITIQPDSDAVIKKYSIEVIATHSGVEKKISLEVELFNWETSSFDTAYEKLLGFKNWLESINPNYSHIFKNPELYYSTYPEILIVEHLTFISDDYEVRLSYHVMIPPYDWSKICIRKRDKIGAELAAIRNTNGEIEEMQISDYPTMFGY